MKHFLKKYWAIMLLVSMGVTGTSQGVRENSITPKKNHQKNKKATRKEQQKESAKELADGFWTVQDKHFEALLNEPSFSDNRPTLSSLYNALRSFAEKGSLKTKIGQGLGKKTLKVGEIFKNSVNESIPGGIQATIHATDERITELSRETQAIWEKARALANILQEISVEIERVGNNATEVWNRAKKAGDVSKKSPTQFNRRRFDRLRQEGSELTKQLSSLENEKADLQKQFSSLQRDAIALDKRLQALEELHNILQKICRFTDNFK